MGNAARKLLDTFDALPPGERQEVVLEILRRTADADHGFPEDHDLLGAADAVFLAYDRDEQGK
jgi:hypothetical protein